MSAEETTDETSTVNTLSSVPEDTGPTTGVLWGFAWGLLVLGTISWFRFAHLLEDPGVWSREVGLWLALAVTATVFSAGCAVLNGVKMAEQRLHAAITNSRSG